MMVEGVETLILQLGLREINTYLVLGQSFFEFMNQVEALQAQIDLKVRKELIKKKKEFNKNYQ